MKSTGTMSRSATAVSAGDINNQGRSAVRRALTDTLSSLPERQMFRFGSHWAPSLVVY
jgi:hypothetical protein